MNPFLYSVTIKYNEQVKLFEARVQELPDVLEFGSNPMAAYELAIDTVRTGLEMFAEKGHYFPEPNSQ